MAYRTHTLCDMRLSSGARAALLVFIGVACSGQPSSVCVTNGVAGSGSQDCTTGGSPAVGGGSSGGGSFSTGGTRSSAASGGSTSTGGSTTTGGLGNTGGSRATGGAATGGSAVSGGASATGGAATGGRSVTGGTSATGGTPSGGAGTGGRLATGGTSATGGATAGNSFGGFSATGGFQSTGGTRATGGAGGVAGSSSCGAPLAGQDGSNPLNPTYYLVDESCLSTPTAAAGFIDLEPVTYSYWSTTLSRLTSATTAPTRIFYSFIPALTSPKDSPVFVIFNGGPAGSTTGLLFAFGTGPMTLHVDPNTMDSSPKPNSNSWAQLGNLLYIDSRQAGFSYGTAVDPTNSSQRSAGYVEGNFNFFSDAADFARVILRVLKSQPALQNNPVVIVGESYGGMRTSTMLPMLLDPVSIGQSTQAYFVDTALSQEIQNHFATVFKNEGNAPLTRARTARQFGWQILIQPAIDFADQYNIQNTTRCDPGYLSTQRLAALGISCPLSPADQAKAGVVDNSAIDDTVRPALLSAASFQQLLGGVSPTSIAGLSSTTRPGAYRLITDDSTSYPYDLSSWTSTQGTLPTYDRYYIDQNNVAYPFYQITSPLTQLIGWYFLQNLLDVHTFITRAALDFVIIPEVIPKSFMAIDATNPVVSSVVIDETQPTGVERPGQMVFTYRAVPAFGVSAGTQRTVRFPTYVSSAHPVTVYQPAEFFADMRAFLTGTLPGLQ